MPESIGDKKVFSLLELGRSIKRMFDTHYNKRYWVKAEMNKLNLYGRSGHCFPDLVEKKDGQVIAEMRGTLWKGDYQRIDAQFKKLVGEPLKEGIKILMQCSVNYDPKFGLSLRIIDIDVEFTLGDLARERKETLIRLETEGVLQSNKSLAMPTLVKRLAIISVETSNGYADFIKVLEQNANGYRYQCTLFPSLLQGDRAVSAMMRQLEEIRKRHHDFDLVAIIRGGGGDVGLSFLNKYELAHAVATFPLPVVTGIGHATNQTVVEIIAHKDAITPTEMADWLIQRSFQLDQALDRAARSLKVIPKEIIFGARSAMESTLRLLLSEVRRSKADGQYALQHIESGMQRLGRLRVQGERQEVARHQEALFRVTQRELNERKTTLTAQSKDLRVLSQRQLIHDEELLQRWERSIRNLSPAQVLKRGYSITRLDGQAVQDVAVLEKDAILKTEFYTGTASSTVQEIKDT